MNSNKTFSFYQDAFHRQQALLQMCFMLGEFTSFYSHRGASVANLQWRGTLKSVSHFVLMIFYTCDSHFCRENGLSLRSEPF